MQGLTILEEIEQKIAYENQKYWQNRFLFGQEYAEFVYDISLNWNTAMVIPKNYLTKNDDFHLTLISKPPEYEKDETILDPIDEKLPLTNFVAPEHIAECELEVFKFAAQYYITILQRATNKVYIPQFVHMLKAYINKSVDCARWLLKEFSNFDILEETLL